MRGTQVLKIVVPEKMFNIDLTKYRIVDLSYSVVPPGTKDRPFKVKRGFLADGAYKYEVETHTHVGTHVETPVHFFGEGKDASSFSLTYYMGRGILLDIEDAKKNQAIGKDYLEKNLGGTIRQGDILICRNQDQESKRKKETLPYLTSEGAYWLRDQRIKMLGVDNFFRLEKDIPLGREIHHILMSQDIIFIEWLDNLEKLQKKEFYFMALPLKVEKIDSSWVRAIAIEEIL